MVGVEDLRPAATAEGHLQSLQAKLCVKAVGELPPEHMPGVEIHDRHQIEEAFLQRDVGDVGGPHLIHRRDLPVTLQAGKPLGWIAWKRGAWFLVDRPQTHAAHQVSDTTAANRNPFSGQVSANPSAAAARIVQVQGVNPGHDLQRRLTHWHWPVVKR